VNDTETDNFEQVLNEWSHLVGYSILHFCDIERLTLLILKNLPTEPIDAAALNLRFAQRVELILSILSNKDIPSETKAKLTDLLKRAKKLSETRNLIVHNPLYFTGYEDEEGNIQPLIHKRSGKEKAINFEDLTEFSKTLETVTYELFETWSDCEPLVWRPEEC